MTDIWISAVGLCGSTVTGSLIGSFLKELPHKADDTIVGYCAGIMLAASTLGLIVPSYEMSGSWIIVVVGVMTGAFFLNVLDLVTPHLHTITGLDPEEHKHNSHLNGVLLFVMAIALHKLPEGMAAGVSMSASPLGDTDWSVSMGIALQNIPEGMVIIAPLLMAGVSRLRTFLIAIGIGLIEVLGALLGYGLGESSEFFLPFLLAFAGGAMLYVTSDEMIPESHTHGYQKNATYALLLGYVTLLLFE